MVEHLGRYDLRERVHVSLLAHGPLECEGIVVVTVVALLQPGDPLAEAATLGVGRAVGAQDVDVACRVISLTDWTQVRLFCSAKVFSVVKAKANFFLNLILEEKKS